MKPRLCPAALSVAVTFGMVASANAQIPYGPYTVELQPVASGLIAPVQLKSPPDGSGRLFVVDQGGKVRVIQNGVLLPTPFLDITPIMVTLNTGYDERGLLGIAFHPNFAANGRFFVQYSRPRTGVTGEPCFGTARGCNSEVVAEYSVTPPSSNVANPVGTVLFTVDKPQFNHDGGFIDFGPDGYLYFSLGDGGGANDGLADNPPSHGPIGNAQNLSVPLGKILRFDASIPGTLIAPLTNPFINTLNAYPGVFAYGLRNPYACSFDDFGAGATNSLIVADVGQDAFEELDVVTSGANMGWPIREGTHCFNPFATTTPPATCQSAGLVPPLLDYPHAGVNAGGIAIVGGYVYRGGQMPGLRGQYIFGDFSTTFGLADGHLYLCDMNSGPSTPGPMQRLRIGTTNRTLAKYVKGFGRDASGEVYLLTSTALGPSAAVHGGEVYRLVPVACSVADIVSIGGMPPADGLLTGDDFNAFIGAFAAGDPLADIVGIGGLPPPDGLITGDDFNAFIAAFAQGCP